MAQAKPRFRLFIGSSSSLAAFTLRMPTMLAMRPKARATRGKRMNAMGATIAGAPSLCFAPNARVAPRIIAPMFSAAVDSKRSAPRPAQSPTLSPTRSAITAGFLGSSSGIPASTLPTRSAPTSAALV